MDLRQHPRVPFFGKARILNVKPTCEVAISNMSAGGLLLHTSKMFDLGKELTVEIKGVYRKKPFEEKVMGRIVAAHRSGVGNSYGLQFSSYLDSDEHPALYSLITTSKRKKITSFLRDG